MRLAKRPGPSSLIVSLLVLLSVPDLISPPISPTILRQTQTYSQTVNFVAGGFSFKALTVDVDGPRPFPVVYEFPLYHAVTGALFLLFGRAVFWGKLVSLAAAACGMFIFLRMAREHFGERVATRAGIFLAISPITLLMSAAFQPDALALMFVGGAVYTLEKWHRSFALWQWLAFLSLLLAAALAKVPVVVPFVPLITALVLSARERWRKLTLAEIAASVVIVIVPFVAWSLYRTALTDSGSLIVDANMFFIGDLSRFLQPSFYVKPAFVLGAMAMCGVGVPLALVGLPKMDRCTAALLSGAVLYYVLMPTAADQTYYAFPLMPLLAIVMARGMLRLEALFGRAAALGFISGSCEGTEFRRSVDGRCRPMISISCNRKLPLASGLLSFRLMENHHIADEGTPQIDPSEWKTGDEPMTAAQSSYLETLCRETGEDFDASLTKAQASERIDALRAKSPRLSHE